MENMQVTDLTNSLIIATVNTDAGYYHSQKVASYAYYIRCGNMMSKGSGVMKDQCKSPLEAEMKSAINAMHILLNSNVKRIDKIILNTDNIHVSAQNNGNVLQKRLYSYVKKIKKEKGSDFANSPKNKFLEIRHVKAHSGTSTKRQWVNDWCDKECTRQLREWKLNEDQKQFEKEIPTLLKEFIKS